MASVNVCVAAHHQRMLTDEAAERQEVWVYFRNSKFELGAHVTEQNNTARLFVWTYSEKKTRHELGYGNEAQ